MNLFVELLLVLLLPFVVAFFLGSIPWGVIISRFMFHDDVREHGSGNIGSTNVMRTYGKKAGAIVFLLDFFKGVLSGVIACGCFALWQLAFPEYGTFNVFVRPEVYDAALAQTTAISACFLGCVSGHIFCPWLGFKGGKGIAVAVGCLFVTYGPVMALAELSIFIVLVALTHLVSLGSVASALACPFFAIGIFWGYPPAIILCSIAGLLVVWAHRENIKRLLNGTEKKFRIEKKDEA